MNMKKSNPNKIVAANNDPTTMPAMVPPETLELWWSAELGAREAVFMPSKLNPLIADDMVWVRVPGEEIEVTSTVAKDVVSISDILLA
jgi:hypothetical protein